MIRTPARLALCAALAGASAAAPAAPTDIATLPLIVAAPQVAKPNLMFILDNSGSMQWSYMPDEARLFDSVGNSTTGTPIYGYRAAQCNGIYYNPATRYPPPVNASGTSYPNASFTAAWINGFDTADGTVNLSTSFRAYTAADNWYGIEATNTDTAQAAYYYTYSGAQNTEALRQYRNTTSTFYRECASAVGTAPGNGVFTRVTVSATSGPGGTDERTNFANWYSYYRTRILAMKTASGRAFGSIDANYRVGFYGLNNNNAPAFLNIATFDATQKSAWYTKLYGTDADNSTPLRQALADTGRIYAGTLTSKYNVTVADPVQYSCQKNFALVSTDGYWNGSAGVRVNGTAIGNEDNGQAAPYGDGNSGTLADVAAYYYQTDLRGGMTNNVPDSDDDPATWQHMNTFGLGVGVRGAMIYSPSYLSDTTGDYASIKNGVTASGGVCSWQASGVCNWPTPASDSYTNVDDLWHASVNGRGKYIAASDSAQLASGLIDALESIKTMTSSGASASEGSPNISGVNNMRFYTSYKTGEWSGDVRRFDINVNTGAIGATPVWSAKEQVDAAGAARTIYTYTTATASRLKSFEWGQLTTAEQAYFSTPHISTGSTDPAPLTQFCATGDICLSAANQAAASGAALVNYLRGSRANEGALFETAKYFRRRVSLLGDIVSSRPAHVSAPPYLYTDTGYSAFKTAQAGRAATVYVGANDGMLHAFDAASGAERWAYVPGLVLPSLFKLADKRYASRHVYYVDGSPVEGDIQVGGSWRTILVGGLNRGGRGYYALDVTNPASPQALWEFAPSTMGYSFGRPEIVKLRSGQWVVLLTSGYNNADGNGYLYILDAATGAQISGSPIATGVGSAATPSGLAQIRAWVDNAAYNNTALRVYGGDLEGNLWRFDVNNNIAPGGMDAFRLATLRGPTGAVQPITTRPEMTKVRGRAVIYAGTGRSLGVTDLTTSATQTLYAIKDPLDGTTHTNPRSSALFVQQNLADGGNTRSASNTAAVDFRYSNGWYVDLPAASERADTDPQLAFGVLAIVTNAPSSEVCTVGGSSYANFFNYATGGAVSQSSAVVSYRAGFLSSGISLSVVTDSQQNKTLRASRTLSSGDPDSVTPPQPEGRPAFLERSSWRELPAD